jgi:hypothetical protein
MTTPAQGLPTDVPTLHNMVKMAFTKFLSANQTVQELMKANMDLRAALHMFQSNGGQLEAYINSILNPAPAAPVADTPVETPVVEAPATEAPAADANPVSV